MKKVLALLSLIVLIDTAAQPTMVRESVSVTGQERLDLEFAFADDITFQIWDKQEVLVEVSVEINNGMDNEIFSLKTSQTSSTIYVEMDEEMWKKIKKDKKDKYCCSFQSTLNYTVFLPRKLSIESNTISGDYEFEYFDQPMRLKTISGAIDITVPSSLGLDFDAKTISGEVFSDIEIEYPEGKEGLRQIVGQDFKGRINEGGQLSKFETISGNIYLRKG